jgi:predicted transcriptional regulator
MEEKKEMVLKILKGYDKGTTPRQITIDYKIHHKTLIKILTGLVDDGKVYGVKFGKATLYKVVKENDC